MTVTINRAGHVKALDDSIMNKSLLSLSLSTFCSGFSDTLFVAFIQFLMLQLDVWESMNHWNYHTT